MTENKNIEQELEPRQEQETKLQSEISSSYRYHCSICRRGFKTLPLLLSHKRLAHPEG